MYLKSLELAGFKSLAKKSELHFTSSITAIVGPNGSGKSNVAEGFRFVLGEQSMKSLRGKKGEDLIFNGTGEVARANRGSVKLVFDNSSKFLNIDFPEVTIERAVHRDGVNEYFINGSQVRLKDVLELLASAHIGASGHHIISQGEADRILNSNSKERKAMLEDALGLKVYQYKRLESERKLEKTEENIKSVESLRREIAPHIKFLKKQVEKVEKALEMKESLRSLYRDYLKREDTYIKWHKADIEVSSAPLKADLKALHEKLAKAKAILAKSGSRDEHSNEVLKMQEKIEGARAKKDEVMRDLGRLEGEISSLERAVKKFATSHVGLTVPFADVDEMGSEAIEILSDVEDDDDLERVRAALLRVRDMLSAFISKQKTGEGDSLVAESKKDLEKLTGKKHDLEKALKEAQDNEYKLQKEYDALKARIDEEKDVSRDAEKDVFKIMSEEQEVTSKMGVLKAREEKVKVEEEDLKRELQEGMVLVGRSILEFAGHEPADEGGKRLSDEEVANEPRVRQEERRRAIEKIKIRLEDAGAGSGDDVMKEYKEVTERDQFLERELGDLHSSAASLEQLVLDLEEKLNTEFKTGVEKINRQFQELFTLMFGGGHASLAVVKEKKRKRRSALEEGVEGVSDEMEESTDADPRYAEGFGEARGSGETMEEEGIEIDVSLPRKKTKGLMMLSGGERALTSIALLFAISQVNPPPFIILDETDAALDEANSRKYGDMVENLSKRSQLILITHNRETMSRAGVLYGVTMGQGGVSKLLSVAFDEAVAVAK